VRRERKRKDGNGKAALSVLRRNFQGEQLWGEFRQGALYLVFFSPSISISCIFLKSGDLVYTFDFRFLLFTLFLSLFLFVFVQTDQRVSGATREGGPLGGTDLPCLNEAKIDSLLSTGKMTIDDCNR
jgi:hypothetical protein